MSEKFEIEVLHRDSFSWVFQRTDRGAPSISIQGDSLSILASQVEDALKAIREGKWDEDVEYELEAASNTLEYMWQVYRKYGWIEPQKPG